MGNKQVTNGDIQARIMKGWKPNRYLSNMSMAYFANPGDWVATKLFPICPVSYIPNVSPGLLLFRQSHSCFHQQPVVLPYLLFFRFRPVQ